MSGMELGMRDLAKYPYMKETQPWLQSIGFDLTSFNTDPDLIPVIEKAYRRIECAMNGTVYKENANPELEILSFHIAAVMIRMTNNQRITSKFALAEARRAEKSLTTDIINEESFIVKMIDGLFGMRIRHVGKRYFVPVPDYLPRAVTFHKQEWKLINRKVDNGFVILSASEALRLIRSELSHMITTRVNKQHMVYIEAFKPYIEKIVDMAREFNIMPKSASLDSPPCIKHALESLQKGENLSHNSRFMLATFMLNRDTPVAAIVDLFRSAPDFNEQVTTYHVKQLAGEYGGGTKYMCTGCAKLSSLGLCYRTPECKNIVNPLQFGT